MRTDSNTILITGGTSGIGKGLAEASHRLGNRVIITGRRVAELEKICAENPGMESAVLDVRDPAAIQRAAADVLGRFPDLNCLINNAGIQREHDFASGAPIDLDAAEAEIATNLTGVIRMCAAFLPHLRRQDSATLINVSSGLAFAPLARFPVYCATKAAIHSFSLSLRRQLRDTSVRVIELIPPYVQTDLDKDMKAVEHAGSPVPRMPLANFIQEAMAALATDEDELPVGRARFLRDATGEERKQLFAQMNR